MLISVIMLVLFVWLEGPMDSVGIDSCDATIRVQCK
ncbi:hypothetical protein VAEKB19_4560004 [Vibrio aestuarianus]|nr:hypothetical protein VAEKB19_4560004 [Vibrio aestuarianus]